MLDTETGVTNFLTVKDIDKHYLRDSTDSLSTINLDIDIKRCDRNNSSSIGCASEDESLQYFGEYGFHLMTLQNFIDYEDVDPGVGPIKRIAQTIELRPFALDFYRIYLYAFIEHQI